MASHWASKFWLGLVARAGSALIIVTSTQQLRYGERASVKMIEAKLIRPYKA